MFDYACAGFVVWMVVTGCLMAWAEVNSIPCTANNFWSTLAWPFRLVTWVFTGKPLFRD